MSDSASLKTLRRAVAYRERERADLTPACLVKLTWSKATLAADSCNSTSTGYRKARARPSEVFRYRWVYA